MSGGAGGGALRFRLEAPLRSFELDLDLAARAGGPLALCGPSGAGKTSALRAIAGLLRPRAGRVALGAETWFDAARGIDLAPERRRCGVVFQDYALFPRMSALRNVAYGIQGSGRERREAARAMLARFGVAGLAEALPGSLSGGESQRVALARALAADPGALLLDEPLSALDAATRRGAIEELRRLLAELEVPTVLVTHSFDDAALLAAEIAILDRGAVVQRGDAATISARPSSPFVADLAGATLLRGEASAEPGGLTLVRLEGGGELRSVDPGRGAVAVSVFPWEISLEPPGAVRSDSMLNRLAGEVTSLTTVGNRTRVGISLPQPLTAEITAGSAARLGLRPGSRVVAAWKAAATRVVG
ncbi:MAG: ATP-binding cassette domain-containing protein [Syntrophothermus sp.]